MRSRSIWLSATALIALSSVAHAQDSVGRTAVVVKQVSGQLQQNIRQLAVKDDVHLDEMISTMPESASQLVFFDGTILAIGENSNVALTKYVYDPRPSVAKMTVNAVKGMFRFTSGMFSKSAYQIETPLATIGVRGTDFECHIGGETARGGKDMVCQVNSGLINLTDKSGVVHEVPAGRWGTIDENGFKTGDLKDFHDAGLTSFRQMITTAALQDGTPNLGMPHQNGDKDFGTTGHSTQTAISGEPRGIANVNGVNVLFTLENSKFVSPNGLH